MEEPTEVVSIAKANNSSKKNAKKKKAKQKKVLRGENWSNFQKWAKDNNVNTEHAELCDFADTGRGMKATRKINKSEKLFSIPSNVFLTVDFPNDKHPLVKVFQSAERDSKVQILRDDKLAVKLMYERAQKEKSFWKDYISLIPKEYTNTITLLTYEIFWSDQELQALQGSNLHVITHKLKQQVQEDYLNLLAFFKLYPDVFVDAEDYTFDIYQWALATIWSRSFDVEVRFPGEMQSHLARILPPYADLFNHDPMIDTHHRYNPKTASLECITNVEFESGKQVFFNYGSFPNHKLLRLYGFALANNPYDVVELWCPMSEQAPMYKHKLSILQQHGISNTQSFELKLNDPVPGTVIFEKLLFALRIQRLSERLPADYKEGVINQTNEFAVLKSLYEGLESMLQGYSTSSSKEEDVQLKSPSNFKLQWATMLLSTEKAILKQALQLLAQKIQQLIPVDQ